MLPRIDLGKQQGSIARGCPGSPPPGNCTHGPRWGLAGRLARGGAAALALVKLRPQRDGQPFRFRQLGGVNPPDPVGVQGLDDSVVVLAGEQPLRLPGNWA